MQVRQPAGWSPTRGRVANKKPLRALRALMAQELRCGDRSGLTLRTTPGTLRSTRPDATRTAALDLARLTDSLTRRIEDTVQEMSEALFDPVIRLGVTGLSRAGKTVFITSLVANLLDRGRMPQLRAAAEGRILRHTSSRSPTTPCRASPSRNASPLGSEAALAREHPLDLHPCACRCG